MGFVHTTILLMGIFVKTITDISKIPSHYPGLPEGYPARVAEFRVPSSEKPKS
jgi:hypothetical protein